jgi:hypothetical protein
MKNVLRLIAFLSVLSLPAHAFAQAQVEMADTMRSEGKIYVVVAILVTILAGLLAYVFLMDRKITRLEKKLNEKGR